MCDYVGDKKYPEPARTHIENIRIFERPCSTPKKSQKSGVPQKFGVVFLHFSLQKIGILQPQNSGVTPKTPQKFGSKCAGSRSSPPGGRSKYAVTNAGHNATADSRSPRNQEAAPGKPECSGGDGRRRSGYKVRKEISQTISSAQLYRSRSERRIGSPRRDEEATQEICGSKGAQRPSSSTFEHSRIRRPSKKDRIQRKLQARRTQEQVRGGIRPRIGDTFQSERARKRRDAGPGKPTYIPRADLSWRRITINLLARSLCV